MRYSIYPSSTSIMWSPVLILREWEERLYQICIRMLIYCIFTKCLGNTRRLNRAAQMEVVYLN